MMSLVIETRRLRLQPLSADDVDLAMEMFTDPDVSQFVCEPMTADAIRTEFPAWTGRSGGGTIGVWCITDRETGEKYGSGVLLPLPIDQDDTEWELLDDGDDYPDREIEVGYILKKSAWGRGIATETCRALLRFAFENTPLETIVATTHPDHDRSQHVLRKCGLIDTGPRQAYAENGIAGFRVTRTRWERLNHGEYTRD